MLPHVKSGRMRGIAVTSERRSPLLPDMPTIAESGVAGFEATGWTGLLAPAATPPAVVQRLSAAVEKALATPETRDRIGALGGEVASSTPEQFTAYIRSEIAKWGKLIRSLGIESEQI
jgi:tripartite-type tricarboxylate transporter receptor subunit TctC